MKIENVDYLRKKHPNFDEEFPYIEDLFNDFLRFDKVIVNGDLADYLSSSAHLVHYKKYFMKNQTKERLYREEDTSFGSDLAYSYDKNGKPEMVLVKSKNIISAISKSRIAFEAVDITYMINRVNFKVNDRPFAQLNIKSEGEKFVLRDYSFNTGILKRILNSRE